MRYHALAADYDGTIAHHGGVDEPTLLALRNLKASGRKLILVTGRRLEELLQIFPEVEVFDRVVAENGAVLYTPEGRETRVLSEPPPPEFPEALRRRGARDIAVGHVIVATWHPHEEAALETIRDMGLELQVIFNKGAVMVLPSGVNKATGLAAALDDLGLSARNVVGVGDAENDHAFLAACECAVAVANALPAVAERADLVTRGDHGAGVAELAQRLIADDLSDVAGRSRRRLLLGEDVQGEPVELAVYGQNVLVCGSSGGGKTTLTTGILERLVDLGYQFVVIDPEGDYQGMGFAIELGDVRRGPVVAEVMEVVGPAQKNAVVNLLGVAVEHRPAFLAELWPHLAELRAGSGRPHWLLVDEAHHMLPETRGSSAPVTLSADAGSMLFVTVEPGSLSPEVRGSIDAVIATGKTPAEAIAGFCQAMGERCPKLPEVERPAHGEAIFWRRGDAAACLVRTPPPRAERKRHSRKYAEGNLGADRSFYFRGPEGKLQLKAHNLFLFLHLADGVDDETWEFHRRRGEYSKWMGSAGVKDDDLAAEVVRIESNRRLDPRQSRAAVREAIESRYTLPADKKSGLG